MTPQWREIIRPETANIILGKRGSGKSGLAYFLTEMCMKEHGLKPVVCNFPQEKMGLLPAGTGVVEAGELGDAVDSVIVIDEGTTQIPAGQRKLEELIKGCQALCRQRNQVILLIFHASSDVGSRLLRGMDTIIVKYPSSRQIRWGSKDPFCKDLLTEARNLIHPLPDWKRYSLVESEEPEFRGLMVNELPDFWSDELSRAWAEASPEEKCPKCGGSGPFVVNGQCAKCYRSGLEEGELRKLDRRVYMRALERGDITLKQARGGFLN